MSELENRLRELRTGRGWSQEELARRIGVSRAEVSGIETGRFRPSVAVALRLADAFACPVEAIFSLTLTDTAPPRWATPPGAGGRFWRALVDGRETYYGVEPTAVGSLPHDGVVRGPEAEMRPGADPARTLVIAGCDPAVGMLAADLARHDIRLIPLTRSSRSAISMLREGLVHAAGLHLCDPTGRSANRRVVREVLGPGHRLLRLARWQEGLAYAGHVSLGETADVKHAKLRWVAREEGSGARMALERILEDQTATLMRSRRVAPDHRATAEAIRNGWAEAGVCIRLAAEEAGLSFRLIQEEPYDLCFAPGLEGDPRLEALIAAVRSVESRRLVGELPGYDSRMAGEIRIA
jgi:molybdate-binding protein/transcriptional regulator with XRE-family HTH domain